MISEFPFFFGSFLKLFVLNNLKHLKNRNICFIQKERMRNYEKHFETLRDKKLYLETKKNTEAYFDRKNPAFL